jgi:hypothetical protein
VTHVLLPVTALGRRADLAEVIGAALLARATGVPIRTVAQLLDRAPDTVRGWVRRLRRRAELVRRRFLQVVVDVGVDVGVPAVAGTPLSDAVAAIVAAGMAVRSRWPLLGVVPVWVIASAVTGGRLLAPAGP